MILSFSSRCHVIRWCCSCFSFSLKKWNFTLSFLLPIWVQVISPALSIMYFAPKQTASLKWKHFLDPSQCAFIRMCNEFFSSNMFLIWVFFSAKALTPTVTNGWTKFFVQWFMKLYAVFWHLLTAYHGDDKLKSY